MLRAAAAAARGGSDNGESRPAAASSAPVLAAAAAAPMDASEPEALPFLEKRPSALRSSRRGGGGGERGERSHGGGGGNNAYEYDPATPDGRRVQQANALQARPPVRAVAASLPPETFSSLVSRREVSVLCTHCLPSCLLACCQSPTCARMRCTLYITIPCQHEKTSFEFMPVDSSKKAKTGAAPCAAQSLPGVEGLAITTAAEFMLEIQRSAADNGLEPPGSCAGGWKAWAAAVRAAGQGHLPAGSAPGAGSLPR